MNEWWYETKGQKNGPISMSELGRILLAGEITTRTLVWRKGLADWIPIYEALQTFQELRGIIVESPPPLPNNKNEQKINLRAIRQKNITIKLVPAGPWSRYFARMIDINVFGSVGFFFIFALNDISYLIYQWQFLSNIPEMNIYIDYAITVAMGLLVEIPVMTIFGTTFGKLMFGISLAREDGLKLKFREIWRRNLILWKDGLGFGIPIVILFFMYRNYDIAKNGIRSAWDVDSNCDVYQREIGKFRFIFGILFYASIYIIYAYLYAFLQVSS